MKGTRTYQIAITMLVFVLVGAIELFGSSFGLSLSDLKVIGDKTLKVMMWGAEAYVAVLAAWKIFKPHAMKHEKKGEQE